jgi:hypothetical protein
MWPSKWQWNMIVAVVVVFSLAIDDYCVCVCFAG